MNPYEPPLTDCQLPPRPLPLGFWSYVALALLVGTPWVIWTAVFVLDTLGYLLRI